MSTRRSHKLFTVDEANELVPELNDIFAAVREERRIVTESAPHARKAAAKAREGGGSPFGGRYVQALERMTELVERVNGLGVMVKDVDRGLCDFMHDHGGELVLLCWKYGEPDVSWWHSLEDGFNGRRAIEELQDLSD
ncbi:MAG: DUF2203 domain-containing protein [Nitrospirota bacterium]|nr:DUF2203 domain-containing protein [Nitrospirota bacterium]